MAQNGRVAKTGHSAQHPSMSIMAIYQQLALFSAGSAHDQPNRNENEPNQNGQYQPPFSEHDDVAALLNQGQHEGWIHAAILGRGPRGR
jgi:hypothetical protein